MSNTFFCILPWLHLYIHPSGDVRTCCVGKTSVGNTKNNTLEENWNSDNLKKIRQELLNNQIPLNCEWCQFSEKHTGSSMRFQSNEKFKSEITKLVPLTAEDGHLEKFELQYVDLRFSNLCNFKCRTCNSEYSSAISYEENKQYSNSHIVYPGVTATDIDEQIIKQIPYLKRLYIAGGEPLVQRNHYDLLEHLVQSNRTDIELMYSTNLSLLTYKGKNILDYWKKFNVVEVNASIDGWKTGLEYWRKGAKWDVIVENVNLIKKETPHVRLGISPTVGWPNLWNLLDLIDFCVDTQFIDCSTIHINMLRTPMMYSLTSLPEFKKNLAKLRIENTIDKISNGPTKNGLHGLINFMFTESNEHFLVDFTKNTAILDSIRRENFFTAFPEHLDIKDYLYENYKKTPRRTYNF